MMNFILALLLPLPSFALSFEVIGPCSEKPIFETKTTLKNASLGHISTYLFKKNKIPFTGDETGIGSIANSPTGDAALEVLSETALRAYGWCVEIDGQQPEVMPDKFIIDEQTKNIRWFYAFALYESGEWTQLCSPSHLVKPKSICN